MLKNLKNRPKENQQYSYYQLTLELKAEKYT